MRSKSRLKSFLGSCVQEESEGVCHKKDPLQIRTARLMNAKVCQQTTLEISSLKERERGGGEGEGESERAGGRGEGKGEEEGESAREGERV